MQPGIAGDGHAHAPQAAAAAPSPPPARAPPSPSAPPLPPAARAPPAPPAQRPRAQMAQKVRPPTPSAQIPNFLLNLLAPASCLIAQLLAPYLFNCLLLLVDYMQVFNFRFLGFLYRRRRVVLVVVVYLQCGKRLQKKEKQMKCPHQIRQQQHLMHVLLLLILRAICN